MLVTTELRVLVGNLLWKGCNRKLLLKADSRKWLKGDRRKWSKVDSRKWEGDRSRNRRLGGGRGFAGRAALRGAILQHIFGVFGAFAQFGPGIAFFNTVFLFFGSTSGTQKSGAFGFVVRATVLVEKARFAARGHAVGDHVFGILGAFTSFLPSSARFVGVLGAQVFSVVTRTFIQTQTFTIADRATRFGTVNEHPVGVGIALLVFFPHGAPGGIGVDAFGFVSRAKLHGLGRVFSHFFESSLVFINFILRFILGQAVSDEFVLFLSLKCKARFAISELAALDRCGDTVGTSQVSSASTGTTRVDAKVVGSAVITSGTTLLDGSLEARVSGTDGSDGN